LFVLSFVFNTLYTNRSSVAQEVKYAESYLHALQKDFKQFMKDTSLVGRLAANKETDAEFNSVVNKKYGIYVYEVNPSGTLTLSFWSSQLILPPAETFWMDDIEEAMKLENGYYLVMKRNLSVNDHPVMVYALIPVRSEFFLETEYLPKKFVYSDDADNRVILSEHETEFPVKSLTGKTLFHLDKKAAGAVPYNNRLTIILRFGGLLML